MKKSTLSDRFCPIARACLDLVDSWTFMILRELMYRNNRFEGIQQQTGINPRTLSSRLAALVDKGIVSQRVYSERPRRYEYRLTEKGRDLWPVMITIKDWGEKWAPDFDPERPPTKLLHGDDQHVFQPVIVCRDCGEPVTARDITAQMSEAAIADRALMKSLNTR